MDAAISADAPYAGPRKRLDAAMTDTLFYPSLSTLLPLESMPPSLGFIQGVLQDVFDSLYYRDLQVQKSQLGEAGFYRLSLVVYKRLGIEIPGTGGAALVFNPGSVGQTTEIPIALSYRWDIVKYVKQFDPEALNELPRLLFELLVEAAGVDLAALLAAFIDHVHAAEADPLQAFVDAYNLDQFPAVALTLSADPDPLVVVEDLLDQLDTIQQVDVYELIFAALVDAATSVNDAFAQISALFSQWVKDLSADDLKAMLIPHCSLSITNLNLALEFPRNVLKPVDANGEVIDADPSIPEDQKQKSRLTFNAGSVSYSTDSGLEFDALGTFAFGRSQIGDTGVILGFSGVKLDLSRTRNIPEATADGRPNDFVGAYVQQATIELPGKWFGASTNSSATDPKLIGENLIFGTGGVTGRITLDAAGALHTRLGKFEAALDTFDVRFERNAITRSEIAGKLTIAGFKNAAGQDAQIAIKAHIAEDGDFKVTASEPAGVLLRIPGVLDFKVYSLGFGREDDRFFVDTSGTLTLTFAIPGLSLNPPLAIDLKQLTIWEDGRFELKGGSIVLPKALTVKIGPVKLSVTAIGMGSHEKGGHDYKFISLDGGLNVNPGGVDARCSGLKIYWRTDGPPFDVHVRIDGIAIAYTFPGGKSADEATLIIEGFLQMKEPDPSIPGSPAGTEYGGGISFKMPKASIGGSAAMRLNPTTPSFIIDTELSLSTPIVLGNLPLGIYAFQGTIGLRYVVDRAYPPLALAADASWFEFYKKKVALSFKEGITIDKYAPKKGVAIGAGLTLGTLDGGRTFSAKLFLLLSMPEALLLSGKAAIISDRVDLSPKDPPFTALLAVTRKSIETAFGIDYKLPESGEILDLHALIEMGFFFDDSSAWYINAGREEESKRVRAQLFTLFNCWSYLMLSSWGIKAGAGLTWDFDKGFGPVRISAHAYLITEGRISNRPRQIGASICLGGSVAVRVCKFKLGFSIAAVLAAEAPKPFIVTGSVDVQVDLPKPAKKLGGTFTLEFTWTFNPTLDTAPAIMFDPADVGAAAKALCLATRERFDLNTPAGGGYAGSAMPPPPGAGWTSGFGQHVVPLDSQLDFEFKKPVAPGPGVDNIGITGSGLVHSELVPPQRGKSAQVSHEYLIEEVRIRSWNPATSQWEDYDVYAALTPLAHAGFISAADLAGLKQGWWQQDGPDRINKLSLLAQTPLAYAGDLPGSFVPEKSGITTETIYCPGTPAAEQCVLVDAYPGLRTLLQGRRYTAQGLQSRVTGADGQVAPFPNPFGQTNGLALEPGSTLEIFFPAATGRVTLRLATLGDVVTILYQRRWQTGFDSSQQPVFDHVTVRQEIRDAVGLLAPLVYDAIGDPIDKVVVIAGPCDCREGLTAAGQAPRDTGAEPPPCGSVDAYFANTCGDIRGRLEGLRRKWIGLQTLARNYGERAERAGGDDDPGSAIRYRQLQHETEAKAAGLAREIEQLMALAGWCNRSTPAAPARAPDVPAVGSHGLDRDFGYHCQSFLFSVCWLPLQDQMFNATIPSFASLTASNTAMATAINKIVRPIWRPETEFAVTIATVDRVTVSEQGLAQATTQYLHVGFSTRGPPGEFHLHRSEYAQLASKDRANEYRLKSLQPYIDFARSYPNADGEILGAKPLFYREPKLSLFYLQPYVYTMYGGQFDAYNGNGAVSSRLEVSILDPVNPRPTGPGDPGYVGPVTQSFAANDLGQPDADVALLSAMATQGTPCTGIGVLAPMGMGSEITVDELKPLKLYLAVFKAAYQSSSYEALRYNFQTSRYGDHGEQVNSYRLKDRDGRYLRDAVFDDVAVTLDSVRAGQLAAMIGGTYPAGDPLEQEYADPFDRLLDGILRIGPLDPPAGTEFTAVRNALTDKVIGVLVRNPEPFNDPKIPLANLAGTLLMSQQTTPASAFRVFHARDRARAFVADPGLDLGLHDLAFTFTYLTWDGATYAPASVVTVQPW